MTENMIWLYQKLWAMTSCIVQPTTNYMRESDRERQTETERENCWHFLTEKIFSGNKSIFSFQSKNCYNKIKNMEFWLFFCKHPIFNSTKQFYNKILVVIGVMWVTVHILVLNICTGALIGGPPPQKNKNNNNRPKVV